MNRLPHFNIVILFCLTNLSFTACSKTNQTDLHQVTLSVMQTDVWSAKKENCVLVLLYVNEAGCQTCNLKIMKDINDLISIDGYRFICYFATTSSNWKRIVKTMNLDYKIRFGERIKEIEEVLCDDGKILLISTDLSNRFQKACSYDELLEKML